MSQKSQAQAGIAYLALPRASQTWIISDIVPVGGFLNIYGKPKTGKSFVALQMASAIATPTTTDFLGFPVHQHGPVYYLQLDTPRSIWADRLEVITPTHPIENVFFADSEIAPYPYDIASPDCFHWLKEDIARIQPLVVMIDTLREAHNGDENESDVMKIVLSKIESACRPAAIVLISHARKGNPDFGEDLMNDNRGSNYVAGRMDVVMKASKKQLIFEGRTAPEQRLNCKRQKNGMWDLNHDEIRQKALELIAKNPKLSQSALADMLVEECGIGREAARTRIRRLMED